jgi:hypothetical protein
MRYVRTDTKSYSEFSLQHASILTLNDTTQPKFSTTLPEKLVAVLSGSRGHGGIMAATICTMLLVHYAAWNVEILMRDADTNPL